MTAYTIINLIHRFKINEHETFVTILPQATSLIGTTAHLIDSDMLTVWELFHGMMLPSGNDAA